MPKIMRPKIPQDLNNINSSTLSMKNKILFYAIMIGILLAQLGLTYGATANYPFVLKSLDKPTLEK